MAAFADLNVPFLDDPRATEKLVAKAVKLGYETIAVSKTYIFQNEVEKGKKKGKRKVTDHVAVTPMNWDSLPSIQDMRKRNPKLKFYSRITVPLEDQTQVATLSSELVQSFDILAVRPTTDKLYQQACKTLEIDIISLDLTRRLPFHLRFPAIHAAVERGVHFEIIYSTALRSPSERTTVLSIAMDLVFFTKGKNIIVSSGAEEELDFRGPYDIVNLGMLFKLKDEQSKAAVTKNCRAVLFHSEARKGTEKSIISGKLLSLHNNENGKNLDGTICNEHEVSKDSVDQNSVIGTNGNEDKEPKEKRAKMQ
ncbi:ribonuclease P protein subunit p30-like [Stylophora pistillata]|nr:ribonuclease P protein subunit p30-like [Stylophora pistillata]